MAVGGQGGWGGDKESERTRQQQQQQQQQRQQTRNVLLTARTEHCGVETRKVCERVVERQDLSRTNKGKVTTVRRTDGSVCQCECTTYNFNVQCEVQKMKFSALQY